MTALEGAETIAAYRWLYGKLGTISGSSGLYPGAAPRGAVMPYIIMQNWPRPDGEDVAALGNVRVLARLRYLIKVVSGTLAEAEPIVRAMDVALRADPETPPEQQSGYSILNVRRAAPFEMPTVEGDEQYWQIGGYYDLEVTAGT
jgi:hypothetical protein